MDATCTIQDSIHVFNLVHKYVSRILGTYQKLLESVNGWGFFVFTYNLPSKTDTEVKYWGNCYEPAIFHQLQFNTNYDLSPITVHRLHCLRTLHTNQ